MNQLDPFIMYTVRAVMDFKSFEVKHKVDEHKKSSSNRNQNDDSESKQKTDGNSFLHTITRVFQMEEPLPKYMLHGKVPTLRRENILSLLYHAGKKQQQRYNQVKSCLMYLFYIYSIP